MIPRCHAAVGKMVLAIAEKRISGWALLINRMIDITGSVLVLDKTLNRLDGKTQRQLHATRRAPRASISTPLQTISLFADEHNFRLYLIGLHRVGERAAAPRARDSLWRTPLQVCRF